jgi:hypothetical protein
VKCTIQGFPEIKINALQNLASVSCILLLSVIHSEAVCHLLCSYRYHTHIMIPCFSWSANDAERTGNYRRTS